MADPYPFTDEGLREALRRLGRRRQKVRRTLRKLGCTGDPDSCNSCPVAVYLTRALGYDDVIVDGPYATATRDVLADPEGYGDFYADVETIRVLLPKPITDFIDSFDGRQYPDLIKVHPKEPPA